MSEEKIWPARGKEHYLPPGTPNYRAENPPSTVITLPVT
jgi:hypothetical protein